ncbi:sugar transferase, partial [Singulisphaera rosea]
RPIFFRQVRLGYRARPFLIYKFRTMREAFGPDGEPLSDAERITNLGRLLRKTSLDELPQLWNVMLGELSLVGPRPQVPRYLAMCTPEQTRRHDVLPGITGWAQINGRNSISWDDKVRYDLWYQDNWSVGLDIRILLTTVPVVLWADGVDDQGAEVVSGDSQLSMRPTASGAI